MATCTYCANDMHFLCESYAISEESECCCEGKGQQVELSLNISQDELQIEKRPVGRPKKMVDYANQNAAGRMYAARNFPIEEGQVCDWAWLKNAGGGAVPILGCSGRLAKHIHHGPDKSTLNNDYETNINHVCSHCHNLWHARNDSYYKGERPKDGAPWLPEGECHTLAEAEWANLDEIITHEAALKRDLTEINDRAKAEEERRNTVIGSLYNET